MTPNKMLGLRLKLRNDLISVLVNLLQHLSKIDSKHYQLKITINLKSCLQITLQLTKRSTLLNAYRSKQKGKFAKSKNGAAKETKETADYEDHKAKGRSAKVLIIGDSMVKHIQEKKISRTARGKSIYHSYSGAKKKDIHQKFQQSSYNDEYVTIILHVSTNDLANDGADEVAERMENLIVDVKKRAKRVGISSVIW